MTVSIKLPAHRTSGGVALLTDFICLMLKGSNSLGTKKTWLTRLVCFALFWSKASVAEKFGRDASRRMKDSYSRRLVATIVSLMPCMRRICSTADFPSSVSASRPNFCSTERPTSPSSRTSGSEKSALSLARATPSAFKNKVCVSSCRAGIQPARPQ